MSQISGITTYNNYGAWLRNKYNGQRVFKVIVDAGFTCPNRDGKKGYGGCTYCNVDSFTPELTRSNNSLYDQITKGIERAKLMYNADKFILYFQPNTNTYAPVEKLKQIFDNALSICPEDIVGLSIGTRADCLDAEKVALINSYTDRLDVDVEIGMESIYETTLSTLNRGCSHQEFTEALKLFDNTNIAVCVHSIFGLPGETKEMMLAYADEINKHPQIQFVKLHHLYIVEGSIMGVKYKREPFKLFEMEEYAEFISELIPKIRPDIVIQRLFGISDRQYLIAPNWGMNKSGIQSYFENYLEKKKVVQGSKYY